MDITRRNFLKISGAAALTGGLTVPLQPESAQAEISKILYTKETTTICPYCGVGCGIRAPALGYDRRPEKMPRAKRLRALRLSLPPGAQCPRPAKQQG
jgi:anaerobic selenocysteine-containing dehydrogenase